MVSKCQLNVLLLEGKRVTKGSCTANLSPCEKQLLLIFNGKGLNAVLTSPYFVHSYAKHQLLPSGSEAMPHENHLQASKALVAARCLNVPFFSWLNQQYKINTVLCHLCGELSTLENVTNLLLFPFTSTGVIVESIRSHCEGFQKVLCRKISGTSLLRPALR